MRKHLWRSLAILSIIFLNIGCDQASKKAVRKHVSYHETIELVGKNVVLTKVENEGAMLSLGSRLPKGVRILLLQILPLLLIGAGIVYVLVNAQLPRLMVVGISTVLGGGIGNIIDRLLYGRVTDFLYMGVGNVHTGIFNMADVSIMLGSFLLILFALFGKKKVMKG